MTLVAALDVLLAVAAAGGLVLGGLVLRRRLIARQGGTFDCSLRLREGAHGKGWVLGIGRYSGDSLEWYRVFSFSTRPRRAVSRAGLQVVDRRRPHGPEAFSLLADSVVVRCRDAQGPVDLAMSEQSLTGFLSWIEAAPPRYEHS